MYSVADLKHGLYNPSSLQREILRKIRYRSPTGGENLLDEDWDTLVILDACRYDILKTELANSELNGELSFRQSVGSATKEWVKNTFSGRDEHDLIYVSANGWLSALQDELDVSLYNTRWLTSDNHRNAIGTVDASTVTNEAIAAHQESPNKRLLVHYVQPHAPYVGETGRHYFEDNPGMAIPQLMKETEMTDAELRTAYKETLRHVLQEVERLHSAIDGKTVISADHGELLGERKPPLWFKEYGHPVGVYYDELVTVPWLELGFKSRRKVVSSSPKSQNPEDEEEIKEHLQALGYDE